MDAGVPRSVRVADFMVTRPKTVPATASITEVRAVFADDHVVMVLLTDGDTLCGTLLREDLPNDASPTAPALRFAHTTGRTVMGGETADAVFRRLLDSGQRRLAVIDPEDRLLGLVCLTRRLTGFCTDEGIAARAGDRRS